MYDNSSIIRLYAYFNEIRTPKIDFFLSRDIKSNSIHILYRMAPNSLNQNKNHLILARTFYRITTKVMGSGSNLSLWEPKMGSRRLKKWNTSCSYCLTSNQLNKDEKIFLAIISPSTIALKYDVLYVYISSTLAAILMTSLLGPVAELRWANWFKLLHMTQSLIWYRSPKIVTKFTRDAHST